MFKKAIVAQQEPVIQKKPKQTEANGEEKENRGKAIDAFRKYLKRDNTTNLENVEQLARDLEEEVYRNYPRGKEYKE